MARRRMRKRDQKALASLLSILLFPVIAVVAVAFLYGVARGVVEAIGVMPITLAVLVIAIGPPLFRWQRRARADAREAAAAAERRAQLEAKYQDPRIVDNIINGTLWQGQSEEQVLDSLGSPADRDASVFKTKTTEVWKYGHEGGNRYRTRVTLENGQVVGWEIR